MFGFNGQFNQPIGAWDTSSLLDTGGMFYRSYAFNQDLSNWDVSNVTSMSQMFIETVDSVKDQLNIDNWTTTSLQNISGIFGQARGITSSLANWDMSNVTNASNLVGGGVFNFDVSGWNINGAVNLSGAFRSISNQTPQSVIDQWNFKNWDISQATNLTDFINNRALKTYNYDDTLISWAEQAPVNALSVNFGSSKYTENSPAAEARDTLINTYGWTITDGGAEASAFVMTVDTTLGSGTNDFLIPTSGSGYNYTVETSDGQTLTGNTGSTTVTFAEPGVYDVEITGDFPQIYFNNNGDALKLTKIKSWGAIKWRYLRFFGCRNLIDTTLNAPNLKLVTSLGATFKYCTSFNGDISRWDVSTINNLGEFLYGFYQVMPFNQDLSSWDVSRVNNMYLAFRDCRSWNCDISGWDVSAVRNYGYAFYNTYALTADLSSWNPVCGINWPLAFANSGVNFDASSWDWSRFRETTSMFAGSAMTEFNLSALDIRRARASSNVFSGIVFSSSTIDAALNTWSTQNVSRGTTIHLGSSQCTIDGIAGRNKLINDFKWTISGAGLDVNAFIITVDTANAGGSASNQFTIPTFIGETYNYDITTSDGQNITGVTGDHTITFASPGIYTIAITGTFPRIHFGTLAITADKQKLLSVERWGPQAWTSFDEAFIGCTNLQVNATDAPVLTACTDMSDMFNGCSTVNRSFTSWNVSTITTLDGMFSGATSYDSSLSAWNVAAVTSAANMFLGAGMSRLQYEDTLTGWGALPSLQSSVSIDFGSATYAAGFDADTAKTSIVSTYSWSITDGGSVPFVPYIITVDTTLGTGTNDFFLPLTGSNITVETSDGQVLTGISDNTLISFAAPGTYDIEVYGGVTTSNLSSSSSINVDRLKLTEVKQWGDPVWTSFSHRFFRASNMQITATDAPNLSKVSDMLQAFRECHSFTTSIDHWDVSNVTSISGLFYAKNNYTQSLNSWDVSNVTTMASIFDGGSFNGDISAWDTHKNASLYAAFKNGTFDQDLKGWDTSGVYDNGYQFMRGSALSGDHVSTWDTTTFSDFAGALWSSSGNPDITNWNMSYAKSMANMFSYSNFNQDISGWDTSRVGDMYEMFVGDEAFNQPIGSWDTSKVTRIDRMFNNNVGLQMTFDQDLSGWNVERVITANTFGHPTYFELSTANYDALLTSWGAQNVESNVTISFGTSQYNEGGAAEAGRNTLVNTYGWTITDGGGIAPPSPFTGLLDTYSGAAAAYSLRDLAAASVGNPVVNVRRSSDNATQDFTSTEITDGTLLAFVGNTASDNGYVTTWYDQSGNGQNAYQLNTGEQPIIVSSGVIVTDNANPSVLFNNTRLSLPNATYLNNQTDFFIFSVVKPSAAGGTVPTIYASATNSGYKASLLYDFTTAQRFEVGGRRTSSDSFTSVIDDTDALNDQSLVTGYLDYTNGDAYIWKNNSVGVENNSFLVGQMDNSTNATPDNIGGATSAQGYIGNIQEIIIYPSDQSANRSGIESNINEHYSIYSEGYAVDLLASYSFDADFSDYTGNNNATSISLATAGLSGGVVSNMANFGGGYLNILDNDDLSFTNGVNDLPFSVSFWANFDGLNPGTGAWIWNKRGGGGTNEEYQIYFYLNEFNLALFSGGGSSSSIRASLSYVPPIGSWHHYAVTYDGSATFAGIKIYVDGVSQTLTDNTVGTYVGMINGPRDVYVGTRAWGPGQGNFDGKLDEMHVWRDRELTSAEVLDIYNTELAGNSIL
jgi:surface protein